MNVVVGVLLFVVGVVKGLPVVGVTGSGVLATLYGVSIADPDLLVLMRHRALLLGLLGAALIAAAFLPSVRLAAIVAGLVSTLGFVLVAQADANGPKIGTTMFVDIVLTAMLLVALALHLSARSPT